MPIYEYQCPGCGHVFEEWVKVSEAQDTLPCPHCGVPSGHVISHTTFLLKGGGWYVTEYGNRSTPQKQPTANADNNSTDTPATPPQKRSSSSAAETPTPASDAATQPTQTATASE